MSSPRLLSLVAFAVMAAGVLAGSRLVAREERARLATETEVAADQIAIRLQDYIDQRFSLLEQLRDEWHEGLIDSEARFRRRALSLQQRVSGFQAINWIDPAGVIRWTVPEAPNRAARGKDLRRHPVAGPVLARAERSGRLAVTPPLELYQGGRGFATYLRLERAGRLEGFLNGVFRIAPLVEAALREGVRGRFVFELSSPGGKPFYTSGSALELDPELPRSQRLIRLGEHRWRMTLALAPSLAAQARGRWRSLFTLAGLAIAGLAALLLQFALARHGELREVEDQYRSIFTNTRIGILIHRDGELLFANRALEELVGVRSQEVGTRSIYEFVVPEDRAETRSRASARMRGDPVPPIYETDVVGADGSRRTVQIAATRIAYRRKPALLATVIDVTDRARAERALRESEARFRAITENTADLTVIVDAEGRYRYVSPAAERIFGYQPERVLEKQPSEFVHPEDWGAVATVLARCRREPGQTFTLSHFRARSAEGRWVPLEGQFTGMLDVPGVEGVVGNCRDISARLVAEEERSRLAAAVEQAAEAILITDADERILYVNPAFERITGYARAEVVGRTPRFLQSGRQPPEVRRELREALRAGRVWRGRLTNRRKDGSLCQMDVVISPVRDARGRIQQRVAVETDVTREVSLEEQLRRAQKMEAVGTLAGGIAHDFNNLLTGILGNLELAREEVEEGSALAESLDETRRAALRAAELTQRLLALGRRREPVMKPVDLNALVQQMGRFLERSLPATIDLRIELDPELPPTLADAGQIEQALLNLAINARDAMPQGGTLTLRTEAVSIDDRGARTGGTPGKPYATVSVVDTGVGMTPEVVERAFDPFFTTKGPGQGTGLGLAMVYACAQDHAGWVEVESQPGRGSCFRFLLPIRRAPRPAKTGVGSEVVPRGGETILLVDDTDLVLDIGRRALEAWGYRVLTARDGLEALRVIEERGQEVDVIVTDLVMPRCGGRELLDRLRARGVEVPVIATTGYDMQRAVHPDACEGFAAFVPKPFRPLELARAVRAVLQPRQDA